MRRPLLAVLVAALVAAPLAHGLDGRQTRALLRIAQKASGLTAKSQVRIVVEKPAAFERRRIRTIDRRYPPGAQAHDEVVLRALRVAAGGKGVLRRSLLEVDTRTEVYDPLTRTAYVRAGATERAAALHGVVHALQDQHFDLRRVVRLRPGSDAAVSALAAVEGHARLASDVLAPRRIYSHGGPKLTRFLQLERGFARDVGLRFASELRNLGGARAVNDALRRFPATSEQVFHLDKYLERERPRPIALPADAAGLTLASNGRFGELEVRALLAVHGVPRLDRAANGWGGGRTAIYRGAGEEAVAVALDWDTDLDAAQWGGAAATLVDLAFGSAVPGPPAAVGCAATTCWQLGNRVVALRRSGVRTVVVVAESADAAVAVALALVP
jgi:hypothetical protein